MQRFAKTSRVWSVAVLLALATSVHAHHSIGPEYDATKKVKVTGKLVQVSWSNPHIYIRLEATDDKGKTVSWRLETTNPNQLVKNGWKPEELTAGKVVTFEGHPTKYGDPGMSILSITFSDGKTLFTQASATGNTEHH